MEEKLKKYLQEIANREIEGVDSHSYEDSYDSGLRDGTISLARRLLKEFGNKPSQNPHKSKK